MSVLFNAVHQRLSDVSNYSHCYSPRIVSSIRLLTAVHQGLSVMSVLLNVVFKGLSVVSVDSLLFTKDCQ